MSAHLADRQIRAAQQAALRLDVRGPVSEALGKAGIVVPTEGAPEPLAETPASPEVDRPTRARDAWPAERVVKPFQPAAWPTRRTRAEPASGPPPLSGLTADERRVHRILLDTLDLAGRQGDYASGLSYVEKKRLGALDLAFINAEIAKMNEGFDLSSPVVRWAMAGAGLTMALLAGLFGLLGEGPAALGFLIAAVLIPVLLGPLATAAQNTGPAAAHRRKIYEALRELALLVDDAPVSDAVRQADLLIDHLAGAGTPNAPASRPPRRARTRS